MTDLDRWSAEVVMGWFLQNQMVMVKTGKEVRGYFDKTGLQYYEQDWHPTSDMNQAFMVVEGMRERGFEMKLGYGDTIQGVLTWVRFTSESYKGYYHDPNPALAICKAAKAAWEAFL